MTRLIFDGQFSFKVEKDLNTFDDKLSRKAFYQGSVHVPFVKNVYRKIVCIITDLTLFRLKQGIFIKT